MRSFVVDLWPQCLRALGRARDAVACLFIRTSCASVHSDGRVILIARSCSEIPRALSRATVCEITFVIQQCIYRDGIVPNTKDPQPCDTRTRRASILVQPNLPSHCALGRTLNATACSRFRTRVMRGHDLVFGMAFSSSPYYVSNL